MAVAPTMGQGAGGGRNSGFVEVGLGAVIPGSLNVDGADGSAPMHPERG